jgi:hypothetical protein
VLGGVDVGDAADGGGEVSKISHFLASN